MAQTPLVCSVGKPLEEAWRNEWLQHKQTAEVDAVDTVIRKVPARIERRCPAIGARVVVERILGVVDPETAELVDVCEGRAVRCCDNRAVPSRLRVVWVGSNT